MQLEDQRRVASHRWSALLVAGAVVGQPTRRPGLIEACGRQIVATQSISHDDAFYPLQFAGNPPQRFFLFGAFGAVAQVATTPPSALRGIVAVSDGALREVAGPLMTGNAHGVRVGVDGAGGVAHVVWGESREAGVAPPITRLMYARAGEGLTRWTPPETLLTASLVFWLSGPRGLHSSPTGVAFAAAFLDEAGAAWIALLQFSDGAWNEVRHRLRFPAAYVDAITPVPSTWAVAYLASAGPGDVNSLHAMRSLDDGRTWNAASLVRRGGEQGMHALRMRTSSTGHAFLSVIATHAGTSDSLLVYRFDRESLDWRPFGALGGAGDIIDYDYQVRGSDELVFMVVRGPRLELTLSRLKRTRVTTCRLPSGGTLLGFAVAPSALHAVAGWQVTTGVARAASRIQLMTLGDTTYRALDFPGH